MNPKIQEVKLTGIWSFIEQRAFTVTCLYSFFFVFWALIGKCPHGNKVERHSRVVLRNLIWNLPPIYDRKEVSAEKGTFFRISLNMRNAESKFTILIQKKKLIKKYLKPTIERSGIFYRINKIRNDYHIKINKHDYLINSNIINGEFWFYSLFVLCIFSSICVRHLVGGEKGASGVYFSGIYFAEQLQNWDKKKQ